MSRYLGVRAPGTVALALAAMSLFLVLGSATANALPKPYDHTSPLEALRVGRVPAPEPDWEPCDEIAECASFQVPLDYDEPKGAQVELALLKIPAADPEEKIGSLFVDPGGPGASAREFALAGPLFLNPEILDHFDIIGMDPRGVAGSTQIRCFKTFEERLAAWQSHFTSVQLPATPAEEEEEMEAAHVIGKGCSTTGQPLASSMSTAEVARDMDVVRRALGEKKLTYYGVSYGSYLGEVYANMFPDRVRALTIDGVVDPQKWVGNSLNKYKPIFDRERSGDAAYKALVEVLHRCELVGPPTCKFGGGNPLEKFGILAKRLRTESVPVEFGGYGEVPSFGTVLVNYNWFVGLTRYALDVPTGWESLDAFLSALWTATGEGSGVAPRASTRHSLGLTDAAAVKAGRAPGFGMLTEGEGEESLGSEEEELEVSMSFEESLTAVLCTDALHGFDPSVWRITGALADIRAPYFGKLWNYADTPCANDTWTAHDEDAYYGPFNRRTDVPIVISGGYWDPATNYENSVSTWHLMPNSRLISNDSWGHGTYWTSACAEETIDHYLVTAIAPPPITHCKGAVQPFETSGSALRRKGPSGLLNLPDLGLPNPAAAPKKK